MLVRDEFDECFLRLAYDTHGAGSNIEREGIAGTVEPFDDDINCPLKVIVFPFEMCRARCGKT